MVLDYTVVNSAPSTVYKPDSSSSSPKNGEISNNVGENSNSSTPMKFFSEYESKYNEDELLRSRMPLLYGDNPSAKREEIRDYFHRSFSVYEQLFEVLNSNESFYQQPEKLRHPLIFYFAHTATFFINKLLLAGYLTKRINPKIEAMCAVGVDEMSWDDLNTEHYDWPKVEEVREYRDAVRLEVDSLISRLELTLPITWKSQFWPILMGIEHERIHLETSSVLIRQLNIKYIKPYSLFRPFPNFRLDYSSVPTNSLIAVPEGRVSLGRPMDSYCYGWDNEYGVHDSDVTKFEASKFLVSNAEFAEFMADNGYGREEFWGEDGWKFIQYNKAKHPVFWVPTDRDDQGNVIYKYRSMTTEHDMPWDWPVDVNNYEAKAFCRWKAFKTGKRVRLPTEDEWVRLRDYALPNFKDLAHWSINERMNANVNFEYFCSSSPVDQFEHDNGFFDVIGNVWQHTETPIYPFKGFQYHELYDDFTVPAFDSRHFLMKGGSFISTGNSGAYHARFGFRPHFYQHAGFRYIVSDVDAPHPSEAALTETDPSVCVQLDAHFGPDKLGIPNFYERMAEYAVTVMREENGRNSCGGCDESAASSQNVRALDIGCGAGRSSFYLAKHFKSVQGLDATTRVIRLASQLQSTGTVQYCLKTEGDLESFHEINLPETYMKCENIEFMQSSDLSNLDAKYANYNLVLATNLLERLRSPATFLSIIASRICIGGLLILGSTYSWDEEITKKSEWIGCKKENGESITSMAALQSLLSPHFRLIRSPQDLPFVLRENSRSFHYGLSQVTVWKRIE
jgi:5-histidylcysteine sulfoxide synthase/putative 4-mercaptohistidine N1-methyltranferase